MSDPFLPPVPEFDEGHLERVTDILHESHSEDLQIYLTALVAYRLDIPGVDSIMPNDFLEKITAWIDAAAEIAMEESTEDSRSA